MRQIVIDTETTGLETANGHRIIEIGCIELIDRKITGNRFHQYLNPQREIEQEALTIHGITKEFLLDKPVFADILTELLNFITGAELIAHNASFDVGFINYEMQLISKKSKSLESYVTVFDTLVLARKKFPGQRNTLDAICKRHKIDLSARKLHGALLDAELLSEVYLLMTGGQSSLFAGYDPTSLDKLSTLDPSAEINANKTATLITYARDSELKSHELMLATIKKKAGRCCWQS